MLVLELPSGGLADALGRKPVLVLAGALGIASTGVLLVRPNVALLALAFAVQGVSRALDSGPLQSWFVDEALDADPHADLERDLCRADVVICAAIGAGALLGSALVRVGGLLGMDPLVDSHRHVDRGASHLTRRRDRPDGRAAGHDRLAAARRSLTKVPGVVRGRGRHPRQPDS